MARFKIKVEEVHICERSYYIEAESLAEAKRKARAYDYDDADAGSWSGTDKLKIKSSEKL